MALNYKVTGSIGLHNLFTPHNTRVDNGYIIGNSRPADIGTNLERVMENNWKEMPHLALANIPTYDEQGKPITRPEPGLRIDPKSVEKFVRTYGGFREAILVDKNGDVTFNQEIAQVVKRQESLRRVWCFKGDDMSPNHLASQLSLSMIQADLRARGVEVSLEEASVYMSDSSLRPRDWDLLHMQTELGWSIEDWHAFDVEMFSGQLQDEFHLTCDLWTFIRYLFISGFVAKKTGVCGNPGCPAPYYLKRRRDQKFCESGCSAYAQRQYSLKWWRENRQGKRAKKRGKSPRRKRQ